MILNLINSLILLKKSYLFFNNFCLLKYILLSKYYHLGYAITLIQLGIRINIFSLYHKDYFFFFNFINIWCSSEKYFLEEGCLSLNFNFFKKRSKYIYLECEDFHNKRKKIFVKGFTSICFQHEIDHIIGKLGLIAQ